MLVAVTAERAEAAAREQEGTIRTRADGPLPVMLPSRHVPSEEEGPETSSLPGLPGYKRTSTALADGGHIDGAAAEDDVAGWFGAVVKPRGAAGPEQILVAGTVADAEPTARPPLGGRRRWTRASLAALSLAIVVIVALAATVKPFSRPPAPQAAAIRAQAAAWVAGQVSPDSTVSCDAVMCAALKAHGFPAGKLVVLGPTSPDPVPSDLVVETSAVRALFGNSLAIAWAPAILASFGSGAAAITVRVVAPGGAAAYQTSLGANLADRKRSGTALLNHTRIIVSATARSQLANGQVDSRLLLALALLAAHQPVDIVQFENPAPGGSPGIPLRFADLIDSVPSGGADAAAYVRTALAVLNAAAARIGPAKVVSGTLQGRAALQLQFTAPSPLGTPG
jgi:hypothetical protein